jgi:hypothetical protein
MNIFAPSTHVKIVDTISAPTVRVPKPKIKFIYGFDDRQRISVLLELKRREIDLCVCFLPRSKCLTLLRNGSHPSKRLLRGISRRLVATALNPTLPKRRQRPIQSSRDDFSARLITYAVPSEWFLTDSDLLTGKVEQALLARLDRHCLLD